MSDPRDEELLRTLADELPVAIWVGRVPSGDVVYVNKTFRQILGMEPPEGAKAGAYVEPYGVHRIDGAPYPERMMPYERVLAAKATVVVDDIVIHRRDGGRVNLRVIAKPIFDGSGAITHVVEAFSDITREIEAERAHEASETRLRQALRMDAIGQLAGGIAHDFNNLLAVVKLLATHLLRTESDPRRQRALLDIDRVTASGMELTRGLLDFARRVPERLERYSVHEQIAGIVDILRRTLDPRYELVTELGAARHVVSGTPGHFQQVVMNLLLNGRDAMPDGGKLVVRTRMATGDDLAARQDAAPPHEEGMVVVEVADEGMGIDPAVRTRIFEPYVTTKTSGPRKGTGLGLSTVYGIVQQHGGWIVALDNAPSGTLMRVLLPCAAERDESRQAAPSPLADPVRGHGVVLLVEDERVIRGVSAEVARSLGYEVVEAASGAEAVALFRGASARIGAVVLDMVMPGMNGRETYLALRAIDPEVRVLVTTGARTEDVEAILSLGAAGFLPKPYGVQELARALAEVMPAAGDAPTRP